MGKKRKNSSIPRHKRVKRLGRLQAAPHWIPKYLGKNIVRGYARHFGVDLICAVKELEMLGYQFTSEYKTQLEKDKENRIKQRQSRKNAKQEEMLSWSDDTFSFIIGYTAGGVPYGVTWEEMDSARNIQMKPVYM